MRLRIVLAVLILIAPASQCATADPSGSNRIVLRTGSFTFPALASVMAHVIKAKEFDALHGFELEVHPYGAVSSYYAALATGEVDTIAGGPLAFQRMRSEGVSAVVTNTYAGLNSLVVVSAQPGDGFEALVGKRLAADMSSSEFHLLGVVAARRGITLGKDVEIVQSTPSLARANLQSGRADAMLTFEPSASLALHENPSLRVLLRGDQVWREAGFPQGWLLMSLLREDWIGRHSLGGVQRWIRALQDASSFIHNSPAEADEIVSQALSLPRGVFRGAVEAGRIQFEIQPAADARDSLVEMFNTAVSSGFAKSVPDPDAVY